MVALLAAGGCGTEPPSRWTVVDSAGVSVTLSEDVGLSLESPVSLALSLGTVGEGGPTEFFNVQDVEVVDSSYVVVANSGTEEVRVFRLDGGFVRAFGRAGRGPREYTGLQVVQEWGDSLLTYDTGNERIAVHGPNGQFVRSYKLEWFNGSLFPVDLSVPSRTLAVTARYMTELKGTGVVVDTSLVSVYDERGRLIDSIARVPHNERFVKQVGDLRTTVGAPYSAFASLVGWEDGFCYAFGPAPELRCFAADGNLRQIWRVAVPLQRVEPTHEALYWSDLLSDATDRYRDVIQRVRDDMVFPEHFPAISKLVADDEGRVWAQRYRLPGEDVEQWWVFEGGRLVDRVTSPIGFEVMDIESGFLAGVWRDELDVEHVRLYRRGSS